MIAAAEALRVEVASPSAQARIIDCGIHAPGGLEAGRLLAEICLAGLATVSLVPGDRDVWPGPAVQVYTDAPIAACLAAQYAGWQLQGEKFFALGSGPMRAAAGREALFAKIGHQEKASHAIGVLETRRPPPLAVVTELAAKCGLPPSHLTLLLAPTASLAGTVQVVARSLETALHKLVELGFDPRRVQSGFGVAPLPPIAKDDLAAIGRTNDAILYGSEVTLWVRGDDESLQVVGPKVPSCASPDYGQTFAEIFERYERDFYRIDPHLFSPAVVTLVNLDSGRRFRFGHTLPRVIHASFGD
jgi:methenyltetrahydromethanopterin cyclohydrolase